MPVVCDFFAQVDDLNKTGETSLMKDYQSHLETLRKQAAESALISALTTVPQKRELFAKHAEHLNALAAEVERAMVAEIRKRRPAPTALLSLNRTDPSPR